MTLTFNALLESYGIAPSATRLLRHRDPSVRGRTLYGLWRDDRDAFLTYQSIQTVQNRSRLMSPHWASFVVTPAGLTMFAGLFEVERAGACPVGTTDPLRGHDVAGFDLYRQRLLPVSEGDIGRVFIDWGAGTRSWAQRAANQPKPIVEIRRQFEEEAFPGFGRFLADLSQIETLPAGWRAALGSARGIYLLTCPRTREQYVGSATGADGFLGRWLDYARNSHGGNAGLRSREPADYQVSVLEVSGSAATYEDIIAAETIWKQKLQSREMGLNRN